MCLYSLQTRVPTEGTYVKYIIAVVSSNGVGESEAKIDYITGYSGEGSKFSHSLESFHALVNRFFFVIALVIRVIGLSLCLKELAI